MVIRVFRLLSFMAIALAYNFAVQAQDTDLEEIMQLAQEGDANAQQSLAVIYATGDGVEQDQAEAIKWYRLAAEQGSAQAQITLGSKYALGQGVEEDQVQAVKWYKLAAEQGLAEAQHTLAVKYQLGQGVDQDSYEAVYWYRQSADSGLAISQYTLAVHYALGVGIFQDEHEAIRLYLLAADQGLTVAQDALLNKDIAGYYAQIVGAGPETSSGMQDAMVSEADSVKDEDGSTEAESAYVEDASVADDAYTTSEEEEAQAAIEPIESAEPSAQELSQDMPLVTENPQAESATAPAKVPAVVNKSIQLQEEESFWSLWKILGFIGLFLAGIVIYMRWRETSARAEESSESSGEGKSAAGYW